MKMNKWTMGLAAMGLVSLPVGISAEEKLSPIQTGLASTVISGYVNTAMQWNPGTGNANPPGFAYNDRNKQDAFSLNAVRLTIERPLAEARWAAGYKVDLMFGQDADDLATQSTGIKGDFAVRQAYVELSAPLGNGLDFKAGVFDPIHGYEVHDAGANPNYTRSYGYTIEPVSQTGVLTTYKFSDVISAKVGIADTFGPRINENANPPKAESFKSYMGTINLTAPQSWGFLAGSTAYGSVMNGYNSGVNDNETLWTAGTTLVTPVKGLKVGAAFDYVDLHEDGYAWNFGGYTSFQVTEKLSLHGRAEYLQHTANTSFTTLPSKAVEITGTVQYDLWRNVLTRLEFRWDHAANGAEAFGGTTVGEPTLKNSYLLAANIIYNF